MDEQLKQMLKYIRLGGLLANWDHYLAAAQKGNYSHTRLLNYVIEQEYNIKKENSRKMRLTRAKIPEKFVIETFPFTRQPKLNKKKILNLYDSFDYMSKCRNVIWIGLMLPMYQSEALWLNFNSKYMWDRGTGYPFAIKMATGKINAVTGHNWSDGLKRRPQDYLVSSEQPWLDGYCVEKGFIRQFVAMPLGSGYSAEEQISGEAEHGGIQIVVYPMKREVFEKRFPKRKAEVDRSLYMSMKVSDASFDFDMGFAPGGRIRQEIYEDPFDLDDWHIDQKSRCFVHIANSLVWRAITSEAPPTVPFTAKEYTRHGLPWFEYYSDNSAAVEGSDKLGGLKSVVEMGKKKKDNPLPENESVAPERIVELRKGLKKGQVREGAF